MALQLILNITFWTIFLYQCDIMLFFAISYEHLLFRTLHVACNLQFYMFVSVQHVFQASLPALHEQCRWCQKSFLLWPLFCTQALDLVHSGTKNIYFSLIKVADRPLTCLHWQRHLSLNRYTTSNWFRHSSWHHFVFQLDARWQLYLVIHCINRGRHEKHLRSKKKSIWKFIIANN